jgi:hypothetical protein
MPGHGKGFDEGPKIKRETLRQQNRMLLIYNNMI